MVLVAINNWLRFDALSIINDLIELAAAILIIVSVVWLPIDLIRWDTRRYALTNRRAIRTEGLFRRSTFDSSLEQINDIAVVETTVGRLLRYCRPDAVHGIRQGQRDVRAAARWPAVQEGCAGCQGSASAIARR